MGGKWRKGPPNFYSIKQVSKMVFFFFFLWQKGVYSVEGMGMKKNSINNQNK